MLGCAPGHPRAMRAFPRPLRMRSAGQSSANLIWSEIGINKQEEKSELVLIRTRQSRGELTALMNHVREEIKVIRN